ncbi:integumentary mucin C.1-like isoform X2 [Dreissena polymorpha]|uniref:integumentary mucin C.1-like isoform X2 n=1 Tax=Dreissena polymorpha TaxID=45954 RepID=UPI002265194A|nr:integumentary mucin C.1-like isoform X2 [Dreissena polymorpha]
MIQLFFVLLVISTLVCADYDCICNLHSERDVYKYPLGSIVNTLYDGDCVPFVPVSSLPDNWVAVAINNEVAYILKDYKVTNETCPGDSGPLPTPPPPGSQTTAGSLATVTTKTNITTTSTPQQATTTNQVPTSSTPWSTTTTTRSLATATTQTHTTTTTTTTTSPTTTPTTTTTTTTTTTPTTTTTTTPTTTPQPSTTGKQVTCYPHPSRIGSRYLTFDQSCYEFVSVHTSWSAAEADCRSQGGSLVTIDNGQEQDMVHRVAASLLKQDAWIGLNDINFEGIRSTYANYGITHSHILHDCVIMRLHDGKWDERHCNLHFPYVCEYAGHNNPVVSLIG